MCDKKINDTSINDIMFFFAVLFVVLVMHLRVFTIEECMTRLEHRVAKQLLSVLASL